MDGKAISVTLCVGGAAYQARLPEALRERGLLKRLFRIGSELETFEPGTDGSLQRVRTAHAYRLTNRVLWGSWRRLPWPGRANLPQIGSSWLADRLIAAQVPASTIFHGITGACLESMQAAARLGAVNIIESPLRHPRRWQREVLAECKRFGVNPRHCPTVLPEALIRRIEREYERADTIMVQSHSALGAFTEFGCGQKTVVVSGGVDHEFFAPARRPPERFRVLYVGRIELAKGVPYLLEAWRRLRLENAELALVGKVRPEMLSLLRSYASQSIRSLGYRAPSDLVDEYRRSSLLVMPSVNEGLAAVMLEGMASGLPVVATDSSGAEDCIHDGHSGFIVPARDIQTLADRIAWCYRYRDEARAMGIAGRAEVLRNFTLHNYQQRVLASYELLVGRTLSGPDAAGIRTAGTPDCRQP